MMSRYNRPVGWRKESYRHYLAAKGVTTKRYMWKKANTIRIPGGSMTKQGVMTEHGIIPKWVSFGNQRVRFDRRVYDEKTKQLLSRAAARDSALETLSKYDDVRRQLRGGVFDKIRRGELPADAIKVEIVEHPRKLRVRKLRVGEPREPGESGLYVLELPGGKKYVGITTDINRRLAEHREGKGSYWTKLHGVSELESFEPMSYDLAKEYESVEAQNELMRHGMENVRGGNYSAVDLPVDIIREKVSSVAGSIEDRQDAMHDVLEDVVPEHAESYPAIRDRFFAYKNMTPVQIAVLEQAFERNPRLKFKRDKTVRNIVSGDDPDEKFRGFGASASYNPETKEMFLDEFWFRPRYGSNTPKISEDVLRHEIMHGVQTAKLGAERVNKMAEDAMAAKKYAYESTGWMIPYHDFTIMEKAAETEGRPYKWRIPPSLRKPSDYAEWREKIPSIKVEEEKYFEDMKNAKNLRDLPDVWE